MPTVREGLDAFFHGSLIEEIHGLDPLPDLILMGELRGAARFFILPTFVPERVMTLLFHRDRLELLASRGDETTGASAQAALPLHATPGNQSSDWRPVDRSKILRDNRSLQYEKAGSPFQSWEEFRTSAEGAGSCSAREGTRDGVWFRLKTASVDRQTDVHWDNPDKQLHPSQLALSEQFFRLLKSAGLDDYGRLLPNNRRR